MTMPSAVSAGTSSTLASAPFSTGEMLPVSVTSPAPDAVTCPPARLARASVAITSPPAIRGSNSAFAASSLRRSSTSAASTDASSGEATRPAPSSVSATDRADVPAPTPPYSSGMVRPARPSWAVICFHTSVSNGSPELIRCRKDVSGLRSATNLRTESASACSSSVSISAIGVPSLPFRCSVLPLRADAQLVERGRPVDTGILGQPENALADDVALDLARAARDRAAWRRDDRGCHGVQLIGVESSQLVAEDVGGHVASEPAKLRARQLRDRAARTRRTPGLCFFSQQRGEQLHGPASGVQRGQVAPHALIVGAAEPGRQVPQRLEAQRAGPRRAHHADRDPLVPQQDHGRVPALVLRADQGVGRDADVIEEHLV